MTRILVVPSSDFIGHPFPQRHNQIFERLGEQGFDVHVVRFKLFEGKELKTSLRIHELQGSKKSGAALYYLANMLKHAKEIREIVRKESIQIVVLSNLAVPFTYQLINTLSDSKVPTILDLADFFATSAVGYIFDFATLPGKYLATAFDLMLRYMIRRSDAVTVVSDGLLQYARTNGARNLYLVPNGISKEFLNLHDGKRIRQQLGFSSEDFVVGYVGSIDFWVDTKELLLGMKMARKDGLRIKGLFVGRGLHTQMYAERLTAMAKNEGLDEDVTRLGFVPHEDVPEFISAFDVGTIPFDTYNPTAYYAAPNKLWEYLSQKRPVISSPIPEALKNLDSISIACRGSDYHRHFLAISAGDELVRSKTENGYCKARDQTWETSAAKFAAVCRRLVDDRS